MDCNNEKTRLNISQSVPFTYPPIDAKYSNFHSAVLAKKIQNFSSPSSNLPQEFKLQGSSLENNKKCKTYN